MNFFEKLLKDYKFITVGAILVPILINYFLLTWHFPGVQGETGEWLGFFANYSGGIIGVLGAYFIAVKQTNHQKEIAEKNEIEENRSFILIEEFNSNPDLKNVITHPDSKILVSNDYEQNRKRLNGKQIPFYKIRHIGKPELIIDCNIEIFFDDNKHTSLPSEKFHIHAMEKGVEIFLPVSLADKEETAYLRKVQIQYRTLKNETILFEYDLDENRESHKLVREGKVVETLFDIELKKGNWILPAKNRKPIDININKSHLYFESLEKR